MAATTTTSIKLDDALKARLQNLAAARRRTVHWLMREAIAEFVEREEQKAITAWTEYQVSGPDKTQEAYAWLARLEAKGVARPPAIKPVKWRR